MLSNRKLGKRLTVALTISLLLAGIAAAGVWGLSQMTTTVDTILNRDAKRMQYASDLESKTLTMRRFEKDVVLNVADGAKVAEYADQWRAARAAAAADLIELRRRTDVAEEAHIGAMQKDLAAYAAGFEEVMRGVDAGRIRTPAAASAAIDAHQDDIRRLDTASATLAAKNVERMNARGATASEAMSRTRAAMWAVCIAGMIVVFVMTVLITRSVPAPIL